MYWYTILYCKYFICLCCAHLTVALLTAGTVGSSHNPIECRAWCQLSFRIAKRFASAAGVNAKAKAKAKAKACG